MTLAVAKRFNLVYVDQVDPPHVMAPNWLDKPLPLHATSGGKAFLAWLGPEERHAVRLSQRRRLAVAEAFGTGAGPVGLFPAL